MQGAQSKNFFATIHLKMPLWDAPAGAEAVQLYGGTPEHVTTALNQFRDLIDFMDVDSNGAPPGDRGAAQLEVCPDTGRIHIQMCMQYRTNQRFSTLLTRLRKQVPGIHLETCKGTFAQSWAYCTKDATRLPLCEPYTWGEPAENQQGKRNDLDRAVTVFKAAKGTTQAKLRTVAQECPTVYIKFYKGLEALGLITEEVYQAPKPVFFTWQQQLHTYLSSNPGHSRWIFWIYDLVGGAGKSTFVRSYIQDPAMNAIQLHGKISDMAYLYNSQRTVFFDVSRTQSEHMEHLYSFGEQLKNGFITSGKYVSVNKSFPAPHVIFFANCPPTAGKWSEDRCKVFELPAGSLSMFPADYFSAQAAAAAPAAAGGGGGGGLVPGWGGAGGGGPAANPFEDINLDGLGLEDDLIHVGQAAAPAAAGSGAAAPQPLPSIISLLDD